VGPCKQKVKETVREGSMCTVIEKLPARIDSPRALVAQLNIPNL